MLNLEYYYAINDLNVPPYLQNDKEKSNSITVAIDTERKEKKFVSECN